jgi:APA family basic amino acid/polyamine antiporter
MAHMADATRARGGSLGLGAAAALVVGNMIGSGVFLLPASLAQYGGLGLAGWLASGAGSVLLALVFAYLARARPASGGPYAYARLAFGDFAGFLVAWAYWISIWATNAALAVAAVGYLDPFIPHVVESPIAAASLAVALVWTFAIVNMWSVRSVGNIQIVTTVIKLLPLGLVGIGGLFHFQLSHFAVADHTVGTIGRDLSATATLTLWAFLGLESATIPAAHVADPDRTIPRATILGTVATGLICVLGTVGVMSLVPQATLVHSTAPFADAAGVLAGEWARRAIAVGGAISCLGALNGWTLLAGETPLAAARDGVFPELFARTSARGTPVVGIALSAALASILVALNATQSLVAIFTFIILLATLGTLFPYALCAVAGLLIRAKDGRPVTRTGGATTISLLAFAYSLWAVAGAGTDVVYWGFLLLLAGVPVFVFRGTGLVSAESLTDPGA